MSITYLTLKLGTVKVRIKDKGPDGNNSWRSIYIWWVKKNTDHGLGTMKLNANYTFDLETWNIQGQGNRHRSRINVYLHLKMWKSYWPWCRYNQVKCQLHIWPWNLEPSRLRSQTKVTMERTHQGLSTSEVLKSNWPWSRYNEVKHQ